jgi:hypothetical protein
MPRLASICFVHRRVSEQRSGDSAEHNDDPAGVHA